MVFAGVLAGAGGIVFVGIAFGKAAALAGLTVGLAGALGISLVWTKSGQ